MDINFQVSEVKMLGFLNGILGWFKKIDLCTLWDKFS